MALRKPLSCFIDLDLSFKDLESEFRLHEAKVLGQGMCGAVFMVPSKSERSGFQALKIFKTRKDSETSSSSTTGRSFEMNEKMFRTEVAVMRRCCHPNVMSLLQTVKLTDCLCLLMPYYSGGTLGRVLHGLTLKQAMGYFFQVVDGLKHLHERNIVHGDIKPNNVLITGENRAVLTDFGLSKCLPNPRVEIHVNYGTRGFRAPETYEGHRVNPLKVDMYALGVTLWNITLKKRPGKNIDYLADVKSSTMTPSLRPREVPRISRPVCEDFVMIRKYGGRNVTLLLKG